MSKQELPLRPGDGLGRLHAVLFDVDGTLIDTTELIGRGLQEVIRAHRGIAPDYARCVELIGRPLAYQMEVLAGGDTAPLIADFIRFYETNRDLERVITPAVDLVRLAAGLQLQVGVVTSKNHEEWANSLSRLGLDGLLGTVVCADDTRRGKPAPDPILAALERLGVAAGDTLYIGDTEYDMQAGREAGVLTGAAAWAAAHPERMRPWQPDFWFDDPGQAADAIRRLACRTL